MSLIGSRVNWLTEEDAACFGSFWCTMMVLRGPPLYLHDDRKRQEGARSLYGSGTLGPALSVGLWFSLVAIMFPGRPLLLAIATGATAIHQFNNVQSGVAQSYLIVFMYGYACTHMYTYRERERERERERGQTISDADVTCDMCVCCFVYICACMCV